METNVLKQQNGANGGQAGVRRPVFERPGFELSAALLPFVFIGLGFALTLVPPDYFVVIRIALSLLLIGIISVFVGLFIGWLRGFPRWSFPYLVLAILISAFLVNASTPGLALFGVSLFGRDLWGWRAWVPILAVALLALAWSIPPWGNLVRLFQGIWRDWPRLMFGLYGVTVLIPVFLLDEIDHDFRLWFTLGLVALSVLGAFLYIRLKRRWAQVAVLLGFTFLIAASAMMVAEVYWQTHQISSAGTRIPVDRPVDLNQAAVDSVQLAGRLTLLMASPILIGLVQLLIRSTAKGWSGRD